MAILKKRQSKQSLPSFPAREVAVRGEMPGLTSETKRPDTGRPVTSTTKPTGKPAVTTTRPALTSRVASETAGARPSALLSGTTKPALTSTTKPAGAKPTAGAGSATSLTTKTSGATRPTVSRSSASGSGLGNTLKNAAIGAGLGMAGKAAYDTLFGKGNTTGTTKPGAGGTGLKLPGGLTIPGLNIPGITKPGTGGTTVKPGTGGTTTTTGTGGTDRRPTTPTKTPVITKTPTTPKGPTTPTGGPRTPTTPKGPATPKTPTGPKTPTRGGGAGAGAGAGAGTTKTDSQTKEDGTTTVTYDDGSTVTMDADGNIISTTEATDTDFEEVVNDDGTTTYTYDDGSTITMDADGNVVSTTDATDITGDDTGEEDTGDDTGETELEDGYFQDDYGNIYDADGNLIYEAGAEDTGEDESSYTYTDDYGNVYDYYGNLISEADHSDYVYTDENGYQYDWDGNVIFDPYADDTAYEDEETEEEDTEDDDYDYGDPDVKEGGLITMMKRGGGVQHFEEGGFSYTDEIPAEEIIANNRVGADPVALREFLRANNIGQGGRRTTSVDTSDSDSNDVVDTEYFEDGSYIEYMSDGSTVTYDAQGNVYQGVTGGQGGNQTITYDDGSTITYDSDGNVVSYTNAPDESGNNTVTYDDGSTITYDKDGNVVGVTESTDTAITSAGGGGGSTYRKPADPNAAARERADAAREKGALASVADFFKKQDLGAAGAGALIGALLGNQNLFGGGGDGAPSIDMSKVGVINPRTTDFGIGAPRFVTYDEYAARDQMPDLYGTELYKNLNAPGFNPVNEGDYGYETTEEKETEEPQKMADGGLAQTYFTFGTPVDPLQNITNPQPVQQMPQPMGQQGGLGMAGQMGQPGQQPMSQMPQMPKPQMPVQPMGQQMGLPMRRGGLPALSEVPLAEGRLDFRQGSAVHGPGDGQSDDIPAMLADGEYVIDAETVAQIGNGSTKAGAKALDEFRENIRRHKRSAPVNKIPPKTKTLTSYLKKGK